MKFWKAGSSWDIETGKLVEGGSFEYNGSVALCKGDHSQAEQAAADAQRAEQNRLMQQQLGLQQQQINAVNPILDQIIKNGGMMPSEESALTSIGINQLPGDFKNLESSLNTNLLRRGVTGGNMAGSGDIGRDFGSLGAMEDYMKSQLLSNIQLQKAQGLQQALGTKLGIGSMYGQNTGLFNQGMLGSLNAGVSAAYNADQAATSWMGPVFGALGSIGSAAVKGH